MFKNTHPIIPKSSENRLSESLKNREETFNRIEIEIETEKKSKSFQKRFENRKFYRNRLSESLKNRNRFKIVSKTENFIEIV